MCIRDSPCGVVLRRVGGGRVGVELCVCVCAVVVDFGVAVKLCVRARALGGVVAGVGAGVELC
eukprot:5549356-Prorocentrum_lima.AAC.1